MQGIYTYIPEKNRVPKEYNVATVLSLLFMVPISLAPALALMYFYISTFRSVQCHNMAVLCSSLTSLSPGMVLMYFMNDFEMVPVALIMIIMVIFSGSAAQRGLWSPRITRFLDHKHNEAPQSVGLLLDE